MICPYIVERQTNVLQWEQQSGEDEEQHLQQISTEITTMMQCKESGCAVWRDGRCCYNG